MTNTTQSRALLLWASLAIIGSGAIVANTPTTSAQAKSYTVQAKGQSIYHSTSQNTYPTTRPTTQLIASRIP